MHFTFSDPPSTPPEPTTSINLTTMADEDEDMPRLSGGGGGDIDLSDETQDFRFLSTLS
jgi:hypothetical protein